MELGSVEAHKTVERSDFRGLGVHEEPDGLDTRRKFASHCGGFDG